jgi:hypothetical protein
MAIDKRGRSFLEILKKPGWEELLSYAMPSELINYPLSNTSFWNTCPLFQLERTGILFDKVT